MKNLAAAIEQYFNDWEMFPQRDDMGLPEDRLTCPIHKMGYHVKVDQSKVAEGVFHIDVSCLECEQLSSSFTPYPDRRNE